VEAVEAEVPAHMGLVMGLVLVVLVVIEFLREVPHL
tara:strand:+ start:65 stop:172 length:108 start_codon:yes stop_codon:yes gene_type:complete